MSSPAAKKARRESGVGATGPDTVVVLDYGSQYTQLITRRVRELGVYSVLLPGDADMVRAADSIAPAARITRVRPPGRAAAADADAARDPSSESRRLASRRITRP